MMNEAINPLLLPPNGIVSFNLTATTTSQVQAVRPGSVCKIVNRDATNYMCVTFGFDGLPVATLNDLIIGPNFGSAIFRVPNNCQGMAFIAAAATVPFTLTVGV